jgi:hypothetical protein
MKTNQANWVLFVFRFGRAALTALLFLAATSCAAPPKHTAGPGICQVHSTPMTQREVEILYGPPLHPWPEYDSAAARYFPNGETQIQAAGAPSTASSPKTGLKYVCAQCEKARNRWLSSHRFGPGPATSALPLDIPRPGW